MGVAGPDISLDDVAGITCPTLVIVADDDVIDRHHSVAFFEALPDGRMAMVPGASHLVEYEHPAAVVALVEAFLDGPPPTRLLPMRTAAHRCARGVSGPGRRCRGQLRRRRSHQVRPAASAANPATGSATRITDRPGDDSDAAARVSSSTPVSVGRSSSGRPENRAANASRSG